MITIIIATYRDIRHIKRSVLFYKTIHPLAHIIIADSNVSMYQDELQKYIKNNFNDSILHLKYDYCINFSQKINDAVSYVQTAYCQIVGDDDFFSYSFQKKAIQFLEVNKEYNFVFGNMYGFLFDGQKIGWYPSGYYENYRSFDQLDPIERLSSYCEKYTTTFYSIFRSDCLKDSINQAYSYAFELVFFDNMFTMQVLLRGKGFFINEPFWFKEMSDLSTSDTYNTTWFLGKNFEKNKKLMEEGLKKNLIDIVFLENDSANIMSNKFINKFLETTFYTMWPQLESMKKNIVFDFLKNKKKFIVNYFKIKKYNQSLLLKNKESLYYDEFFLINSLIKDSSIVAYRKGFAKSIRL